MTTSTVRTPSARKPAPVKNSLAQPLMSRAEMLKASKPAVKKIIERAEPKTQNFLLDLLRVGRAGILK